MVLLDLVNITKSLILNKVSFIAFLWLQSSLVGKAREVYSALSIDDSAQYKDVKKAVLRTYELLPGTYRQKFLKTVKNDDQTHIPYSGKVWRGESLANLANLL